MNKRSTNGTFEEPVHSNNSYMFLVSSTCNNDNTFALSKKHTWSKNTKHISTSHEEQQQEQEQQEQEVSHLSSALMHNHHFPEDILAKSSEKKCQNYENNCLNNYSKRSAFVNGRSKSWYCDKNGNSELNNGNNGDSIDHNNTSNNKNNSLRRLAWSTNNVGKINHHAVNSCKSYISLPFYREDSDELESANHFHEGSVKTCISKKWGGRGFNHQVNRTRVEEALKLNNHNQECSNNINRFISPVNEIEEDDYINVKFDSMCAEPFVLNACDNLSISQSCCRRSSNNIFSCCSNSNYPKEQKEECHEEVLQSCNCDEYNDWTENDAINNLQEDRICKSGLECSINESYTSSNINKVNNVEEECMYCKDVDIENENNSCTTHAQHKKTMNTWLDHVQNVNKHRVKLVNWENAQTNISEEQCTDSKEYEYFCENDCENTDSVYSPRFNVAQTQFTLSRNPDKINSRVRGHKRCVHSQCDYSELLESGKFLLESDVYSVTGCNKHHTVNEDNNNNNRIKWMEEASRDQRNHDIERETLSDVSSNFDVVYVKNGTNKICGINEDNDSNKSAHNHDKSLNSNCDNAENVCKNITNKLLVKHISWSNNNSTTNINALGDDYHHINDDINDDVLNCNSSNSDDSSSISNDSNNNNIIKMLNSATLLIHSHSNEVEHDVHVDGDFQSPVMHRSKTSFLLNNSKKCDDNNKNDDGDDDVNKIWNVYYSKAADSSASENVEDDVESTIEEAVEELERNLVFLPYQNDWQEIEERSLTERVEESEEQQYFMKKPFESDYL